MQKKLSGQMLVHARPFVKRAGGKPQMLDQIVERLPRDIVKNGVIERYVEPFVGGGGMFFRLKGKFDIAEAFLFDANKDLCVAYRTIQENPEDLIDRLRQIEGDYDAKGDRGRREFYYTVRDAFNGQSWGFRYDEYHKDWVDRTAYLLFLNQTCHHGLFSQNGKGEFNVPYGHYKTPRICDEENLMNASVALQDTTIVAGDFAESLKYVKADTFVYLDPPYRPSSSVSNFSSYSRDGFSDNEQRRLADYCVRLDERGAYLMLSNSDPKNEHVADEFFDQLAAGYTTNKALSCHVVSSHDLDHSASSELIITNYP